MERYNSRTIDELGRLSLHSELRQKLGLQAGNKICLKQIDTIVVLQRAENATEPGSIICQVSDIGMIDLPIELRKTLGWKEKTKIALYHTDNLIILKSA